MIIAKHIPCQQAVLEEGGGGGGGWHLTINSLLAWFIWFIYTT